MREVTAAVFFSVGCVLTLYGLWLMWPALAVIVLGLAVLALGVGLIVEVA